MERLLELPKYLLNTLYPNRFRAEAQPRLPADLTAWFVRLWLALFLGWLLWSQPGIPWQPEFPPITPPIWGEKPVLGYFALTPSLSERLWQSGVLNLSEYKLVQEIANQEEGHLRALQQESQMIVQDSSLSLSEKRLRIAQMAYNQRVEWNLKLSQVELQKSIQPASYANLVSWIEEQWKNEVQLHGLMSPRVSPRTFEIFATRYDSKGAYTVALPDKCLKFANAGNHICDEKGYSTGQDYTVYLSYKKSVAARVLEAGPWNVDDNFWSRTSDPQPRRMFQDLALGMPEAQAAYFNGYNGGLDQFGRKVTAPFAIDLARQVSIDIGLQPGVNDWITVSFMWTDGWNGGSSKPGSSATQVSTQTSVVPIITSTPNPDGSTIHTVQTGQTLWGIAAVYDVSLDEILNLNGLSKDALIYPGQNLTIKQTKRDSITPSYLPPTAFQSDLHPTALAQIKMTAVNTPVSRPETSSQVGLETPSTPLKLDSENIASAQNTYGIDPLLIGIFVLLAVGIVLVVWGTSAKNKR